MATWQPLILLILAVLPILINAGGDINPQLNSQFVYKYDLSSDVSVDNYQGDSADPPDVTVIAQVTLSPVASPDLWSLELSSVKVEGNGKKTEIQDHSEPLFVQYSNGALLEYYLKDSHHHDTKEGAFSNILKSVANLFQSHSDDNQSPLGSCSSATEVINGKTVVVKSNCHADKPLNKHSSHPLGLVANVQRDVTYKFNSDKVIDELASFDSIEYSLAGNKETKSRIVSNLKLKLVSKEAIAGKDEKALEFVRTLKKLDKELFRHNRCYGDHCLKLKDFVEFRSSDFEKSKIGTDVLALSTLTTLLNTETPCEKEVEKLLSSKKVKPIRGQILDILGAFQAYEVYTGVMASLMDKDDSVEDLERYLQTLAVGSRPDTKIMEDILNRLTKDKFKSDKIKSTLIMTLSSMSYNYGQLESFNFDLIDSVDTNLWEHFLKCKEIECSAQYLRGYLNMKLFNRIPDLLLIVQKQHKILGTIAMKALQHFPIDAFSEKSQKIIQSIFHQTVRRYDSSIRTLALDILMKADLDEESIKDLLQALKQQEKSYEVKQYLLEQFKLRFAQNDHFRYSLGKVIRSDPDLNNYHRIATGGLSTALSRQFLTYPSFNSSMSSVQEIQKGVLKRGIVDMYFTTENEKFSYFTLELYARGMSNMMGGSSDDKDDEPVEEETLTAGMELIVHGQSLRPLEFFTGQGELMGHVWSGTASERTPAYQATTLFFDHRFEIPLQSGFIVQFDLLTAISMDLSGQVTLSLWNRNGKSKVEQSIGFATIGRATVVTEFSRTTSEFRLLQNPKLNLMSDFEFSGNNLLCLQLTQPDITLRKTYWKKNSIPALKISDEKEKQYSFQITGNSHLLNAKNNEMCRTIHNEL